MLQHVIDLLHRVGLFNVDLTSVLRMQVHHVLTLLRRANQLSANLLLLEVQSEGIHCECGIRWQSNIAKCSSLPKELLAELDEVRCLGVDHHTVYTWVGVVERSLELLCALLLCFRRVDHVGLVWTQVRGDLVCEIDSLLSVVDGDDLETHCLGILHSEVSQTTDADHGNPLTWLGVDGEKCSVDSRTGAEKRSGLVPRDVLGDLGHHSSVGLHILCETTIDCETKHSRELFAELLTCLASIAAVTETICVDAAHAVVELNSCFTGFGSGFHDEACWLVGADDAWLRSGGGIDALLDLEIRVAIACCLDLDENVVFLEVCWNRNVRHFVCLVEVFYASCAHLLGDLFRHLDEMKSKLTTWKIVNLEVE